ncbi:response regulator [Caenimonas sedimenti]|uniref:Chemotaxis protein CheA n=1 Tax=Caenimonas sedimenti TaxID=2596921 RepID=A0A562ZQH6_9BURK|nr:Hpt domain-containing protein [Caenimonas sedimenti]TWO70424.1 response regulator [Caenimonas sedimenti]
MQATAQDQEGATNDLGPLAWVLDELRKSLESASSALRRFVRDAAQARGEDMASIDTGQLRIARQHMHQAVGALEMVGLGAPAHMLRTMEAAAQKFVERPELCTEAAASKVERGGFALTEYLEALLGGKAVSPLSLFPQYKDVQEICGADRIHPADLWAFDWRWNEPQSPEAAPLNYETSVRSRLDQSVLKIVKTADAAAGRELTQAALGLAAAQTARQPKVFWKVAAGYFEAVGLGLLPSDIYVKRAASRVLLQYASLAKGELGVSDRLAQDLVFFCSQAVPPNPAQAPALSAVRQAYNLNKGKPVDYSVSPFGRFDPILLAQARKRITAAKETWSALSGGDANKLKGIHDQFQLVCDALVKLYPPSGKLAESLMQAIDFLVRAGRPPGAELAMEVATSVLYLEAAFQDLDPNDAQLAERTQRLAERLTRVLGGNPPEPLEHWVEELYRRVSDRQTMGSVVGELRGTLSELEKVLDQFFRDPSDRTQLRGAPGFLAQMRGVISVLGLDQASQAILHMRDTVESIVAGMISDEDARANGTYDKLGNNLGALGFLIDMLNYQPSLAKKLFVYDEARGELRPLMGRVAEEEAAPEAPLSQEVHDVVTEAGESGMGELGPRLDTLAAHAVLADNTGVASAAREASAAVSAQDEGAATVALQHLAATMKAPAPPPAPAPAPVALASDDEDDGEQELRDIFLEEAREVVGNGLAAVQALHGDSGNISELTTLRRAFHTLKGSSRMVGLTEFGEAAWSMEQVLNGWLAEQKPSTEDLRTLSAQAMEGFGRWVEDISKNNDSAWKAGMFRTPAEAFRSEQKLLPFLLPGAGAAEAPAAPAEVVAEVPVPLAEPVAPPAAAIEAEAQLPAFDAVPADPVAADPFPPVAVEAAFELPVDVEAPAPLPETVEPLPAFDAPVPEQVNFNVTHVIRGEPPEVSELPAGALPPEFEMDLGSTIILPEPAAQPQALPEVPLEVSGIDFGSLASVSGPAPLEAVPEPVAELPPAFEVPELPAIELPAEVAPEAPLEIPLAGFEPIAEPEPDAAMARDEQTKVIGSLRIGIPLYNVYLNEADEWSRRLATEVSEWALEANRPVPDSTVGLAHALAGSSATVGFNALSDIARALEGQLQRAQGLAYTTPQHVQAFTDAAEEVRRLLHQFAAGFLKDADPRVALGLQALQDLDIPPRSDPETAGADDEMDSQWGAPAPVQAPPPVAVAAPQPAPAQPVFEQPVFQQPVFEPPAFVPPAPVQAPVAQPVAAQAAQRDENEDDLDVVDAIDPDLFPIFEEEAADLMPALGSALRQWAAQPGHRDPRDQVLRALHTLKGSARLAGALRLGELAHRLESEVEYLGHEGINSADIEALLHRFDNMQARFDTLRATGGFAPSEAPAAVADSAPAELQASAPDAFAPMAEAQPLIEQPVPDATAFEPVAPVEAAQPVEARKMLAPAARTAIAMPTTTSVTAARQAANQTVRVRSQLMDRLVNQAGEVMITRSRLEAELRQLRGSLGDLTGNLDRLRGQLRDIEVQAESQMQSRMAQAKDTASGFDPLEFDRFTRVQELTRMMAESVNDVATVQRNIQRVVEATEDDLIAQARQTRELQRDLLRTRMVEFEGISDRLYRVVRLAAKESAKQVKLDILGGSIEMDRGVLDRMTPAFEHLLRNCVAHGVEVPDVRTGAGKDASGTIVIHVRQEGNDVSVEFQDDGAGLNLGRIRDKALQQGLITPDQQISDDEAANLIFLPGFSTATQVTELAGRGIGMDVVRSEVAALGGRIETRTQAGQGSSFKLVLPLTTAVTQVVMVRSGKLAIGVPANLVELVRRATQKEVEQAYNSGSLEFGGEQLPFFWSGALLQSSTRTVEPQGKTVPIVIFRSAAQRVAVHVDEVLGNQEVVVKNLGPQLARLPGLAGMTVLASGAVVLIYNPVALTQVYGERARQLSADRAQPEMLEQAGGQSATPANVMAAAPAIPLVLVVDDSITVRRVTQRLLQREGYRVSLAADGLQALERLADERPSVVLSDIEMPRMDGFDLARNIRGDARLKDLPIVMITSRIAEKHREHARELGVNNYLGKPYSEEELLSLVKHYCTQAVTA